MVVAGLRGAAPGRGIAIPFQNPGGVSFARSSLRKNMTPHVLVFASASIAIVAFVAVNSISIGSPLFELKALPQQQSNQWLL